MQSAPLPQCQYICFLPPAPLEGSLSADHLFVKSANLTREYRRYAFSRTMDVKQGSRLLGYYNIKHFLTKTALADDRRVNTQQTKCFVDFSVPDVADDLEENVQSPSGRDSL